MSHPQIIQGGMGAGVSGWRLARTVSAAGELGVVSGTGIDVQLARRLQLGDPEGHMRRALARFPDQDLVARVLERYFRPRGLAAGERFADVPRFTIEPRRDLVELTVLAGYVEMLLARDGHPNPVGINFLEKIPLPTLPALYGAMLAGVDYVLVGAGIPLEVPGALDRLAAHQIASLPVHVVGEAPDTAATRVTFDPAIVASGLPELRRPYFLTIISSVSLAQVMLKRANGKVDGFVVEAPEAGGHNAPPRGPLQLDAAGEPIYGARDVVDLGKLRALGAPFWLAGRRGRPGMLAEALAEGATGIQVGTAFAFCRESGLDPQLRRAVLDEVAAGRARVFTDPLASPTGYPFKVVQQPGTLSDPALAARRQRDCNLGYLRTIYRRPDGGLGYRCPAEPVSQYVHKGGSEEDAVGRKCLCNGLMANIGLGQSDGDGHREAPLLTAGDDLATLGTFLAAGGPDYGAEDVLRLLRVDPARGEMCHRTLEPAETALLTATGA
jgi:nitronate monooxygenase